MRNIQATTIRQITRNTKVMATLSQVAPRLTDKVMTMLFDMQLSDRPEEDRGSPMDTATSGD